MRIRKALPIHTLEQVRDFFACSSWIDHLVLRPLSHIAENWEVSWDHVKKEYKPEESSFAEDLNVVVDLISVCPRPEKYHEFEDNIVAFLADRKWPLQKKDNRWITADYPWILEQGGFSDLDQKNLVAAATGRVHAALDRKQMHFDEMEEGHLYMLAAVLTIIIYHRDCSGLSKRFDDPQAN